MKKKFSYKGLKNLFLVRTGEKIIGDPEQFGVKVSSAEFYCEPSERVFANPEIQRNAGDWEMMTRNVKIDYIRRKVFQRVGVYSSLFSIAVLISGFLFLVGVDVSKNIYFKAKEYISNPSKKSETPKSSSFFTSKKERLSQIEYEVLNLNNQLMAGKLSHEEFGRKTAELSKEYESLTK